MLTPSEATEVLARHQIPPEVLISILSHYSTEARLRALFGYLAGLPRRSPWLHRELATIVCASREKVTLAISRLRSTTEGLLLLSLIPLKEPQNVARTPAR
jgi:hypothetical protein